MNKPRPQSHAPAIIVQRQVLRMATVFIAAKRARMLPRSRPANAGALLGRRRGEGVGAAEITVSVASCRGSALKLQPAIRSRRGSSLSLVA